MIRSRVGLCEHEHGQTQREVNSINMALFTLFHITTYNQLPIKLVNTQHFTKKSKISEVCESKMFTSKFIIIDF